MTRANKRRGDEEVKQALQTILKQTCYFLLCICLTMLPYLTLCQSMGLDTFIDSFEHTNSYSYLQNTITTNNAHTQQKTILFIQRTSHPAFAIEPHDTILYHSSQGIQYNKVTSINKQHELNLYTIQTKDTTIQRVYPSDVIGKVITTIDDNLWNELSIILWETSVSSLNIRALFTQE